MLKTLIDVVLKQNVGGMEKGTVIRGVPTNAGGRFLDSVAKEFINKEIKNYTGKNADIKFFDVEIKK